MNDIRISQGGHKKYDNLPKLQGYDVSVVVVTYKPVWEKYKRTLDAILNQRDLKIQIVLSDDGSKDNLFEKCREYFAEHHFVDYIMLADDRNRGTVLNCYKGVKAVEAEYVHLTSPGDYLREEDTLKKWISFLKNSGKRWAFADVYYYHINEQGETVITSDLAQPQLVTPYLKHDDKLARYCYVCLGEQAVGAAVLSEKEVLLEYLERIIDKVVYVEDSIYRLMMFDGIVGEYFPKNAIMYEYGTGISTSGSEVWRKRIDRDWEQANQIMIENYDKKDKLQCQMVNVFRAEKINNKWVRKIAVSFSKRYFGIRIKRKFAPRTTAVK